MSQLSAQSIRKLCLQDPPLIRPFAGEKTIVNGKSFGLSSASYDARIAHDLSIVPGESALACTVEEFHFPHNVVGYVCDKSSFARIGVSAFNTLFDPGFYGHATLELVNLGKEPVRYLAGDPVCQFTFHWLDEPTERPYRGKYAGQERRPVPARYDNGDGTWKY